MAPARNDSIGPWLKRVKDALPQESPGGQISQWFDSLLASLNKLLPYITASRVPAAFKDLEGLSEIDRILFLKFLATEVGFLGEHRIMTARNLQHKIEHDRSICEKKQAEIRAVLVKLVSVEGIDDVIDATFQDQLVDSMSVFAKMVHEPTGLFRANVDEVLDQHETTAVRKILEALMKFYGDGDFDAHAAWLDLKRRWHAWSSTHDARIAGLKKLWAASGGGAPGSNPSEGAIKAYYTKLYEQIELGNLAEVLSIAAQAFADPWKPTQAL